MERFSSCFFQLACIVKLVPSHRTISFFGIRSGGWVVPGIGMERFPFESTSIAMVKRALRGIECDLSDAKSRCQIENARWKEVILRKGIPLCRQSPDHICLLQGCGLLEFSCQLARVAYLLGASTGQLGIQNLWPAGVQQVPITAPWRHPFLQRAECARWAAVSLSGRHNHLRDSDVPRPGISPRSHDDHFATPQQRNSSSCCCSCSPRAAEMATLRSALTCKKRQLSA
jgi:hypothetical protein